MWAAAAASRGGTSLCDPPSPLGASVSFTMDVCVALLLPSVCLWSTSISGYVLGRMSFPTTSYTS